MHSPRRWAWIALAISCGAELPPAPKAVVLEPSAGADDAETPVFVRGDFSFARVRVERDRASLTGVELSLDGQALAPLRFVDRETLATVVPAGMRYGPLPLLLEDPWGQPLAVPGAFCVLTPAAQVEGLEVTAPAEVAAGVSATIGIRAMRGGQPFPRFTGRAVLFAPTGTVSVGPFEGGVWSGSVDLIGAGEASLRAEVDLSDDPSASCGLAGSGEVSVVIDPGAFAFTTPNHDVVAGTCSPVITLSRTALPVAELVSLTSTVPDVRFFRDGNCREETTTIEIASGTTDASFYLMGTVARPFEIHAEIVSRDVRASQAHRVVGGAPVTIVFDSARQQVPANTCSEAVQVALRDAFGNRAVAQTGWLLQATSDSGTMSLSTNSSCAGGAAQATIPIDVGQAGASFYFSDAAPGEPTIRVDAPNGDVVTQPQTIVGPATAACGNGRFDPGEACDDGNAVAGDGCSACTVDAGRVCAHFPSRCFNETDTAIVRMGPCPGVGTEAEPFCTINLGLAAGKTFVIVRPGYYQENVLIRDDTKVIVADAGAVLDNPDGAVDAVVVRGKANVIIAGLHMIGAGTVVSINDVAAVTIDDARIGPSGQSGVVTAVSGFLRLRRTYVMGNVVGVDLGSSFFTLENSVIAGNSVGLRTRAQQHASSKLVNLTIADSAVAGVDCVAGATLINTIVWNGAVLAGACTAVNACLLTDPMFTPDGSYHLQPSSPCIDQGTSMDAPADDLDGELRPRGGGIDIGADEAG